MISQNSSKNSAVKTVQHRMSRLRDFKLPFTSTFSNSTMVRGKVSSLNFLKIDSTSKGSWKRATSKITQVILPLFHSNKIFFLRPPKHDVPLFFGWVSLPLEGRLLDMLGLFPFHPTLPPAKTSSRLARCVYGIVEGVGSPSNFPWKFGSYKPLDIKWRLVRVHVPGH